MKERLLNNFSLKLLSLLLAFFLWLLVVNVSNPMIDGSKEVQLEIENEDILENAGLTYEIAGKSTVTVRYNVATLDAYRIQASDFRAYIDLADLYDVTGAVPVNLEVVNNQSLISSPEVNPGVVQVETEELQRKRFDLTVTTTGEPEEGYALGDVTLDPEYLYISGPVSQVGQISSVGVEIDVSGVNANMSGTTGLVFYDANGNRLTVSDRITYDVSQIGYEVEILRVRSLPLDFEVSGTVANGYVFAGLTSDVQSLTVAGLKTNLSNLSTITVDDPQLNIQGATQSRTIVIDLTQYVPDNVSIVGGTTEATVTLEIEPLASRTFSLNLADVSQTGASVDYEYSFTPETVEVTVQGLQEDLDAMSEEDLGASLNLSEMTAGTAAGTLSFELDEGLEILSYTPFEITVTDRGQEAAATEDSTAEEAESEETESDAASESTDHE
ncbi:MAG TPA: hypothetical protein IAA17_06195 [Candidatus Lachnoclostridium stercorigallinarum]|uniref:YbbR domain-containing protein n=1 Tax=Candidatus Lachnoclostridium stercorigallinarum TaxID=2838634 RepID=A0A9D2GIC3_9FIRM|nr:hypothetical protein [Candidatus Lachnoclostridium stercorigallinarum]